MEPIQLQWKIIMEKKLVGDGQGTNFTKTVLWVLGATDKPCGVRTVANPKQLLNGT